MNQAELGRQRIRIYEQCAETRTLPNQKDLDTLTPESAKPVLISKRRELTPAEERKREQSLLTEEGKQLRKLDEQGKRIAGEFGENVDALNAFVREHPEMARFFPQRRLAA